MHQLKHNDAVFCNNAEEWGEIIKLAAIHEIYFYDMGFFIRHPVIYFEQDALNSNDCYEKSPYGENLKLHSFEDFCAKIKGEYKEELTCQKLK